MNLSQLFERHVSFTSDLWAREFQLSSGIMKAVSMLSASS